jgi:phosphate-selective porin OprO/OprP
MTRSYLTLGVASLLLPAFAHANTNGSEAPTATTPIADDFSKVYWNNDLRFETEDKQFTTRIGGRLQFDGWYTDDRDQAGGGSASDGWRFRRARLYVQGTVYGNVHYKAQYDFADSVDSSAPDFRDLYVKIDELLGPLYLQAGQFFVPFGMETQSSTNSLTFMERDPLVTLGPGNLGRSTGLATGGNFGEKNGVWKLGLFNVATTEDGDAIGGTYEGAGRVTYKFALDDGSFVHVGGSVASGSSDGVRFRARPGTSLGNFLVDTGAIADADATQRFGGEVAGVFGPFSAQAELINTDVDSVAANDPGFTGYYLLLSYFLTGESRSYSEGLFSTIKPTNPWKGWGEGSGAWEIAFKYSALDIDDVTNDGQELMLLSGGVNWYLNANTRITFNYTTGENDEATSVDQDSYGVRFQVTF